MTDLRVAERTTLSILSAPTVTRDLAVTKSIAEQYHEVVNAPRELNKAIKVPLDAIVQAPKSLPAPHPNVLVRHAGWFATGAAGTFALAAAAAVEAVFPGSMVVSGGLSLIVGAFGAVAARDVATDKRSKAKDDAGAANRKKLEDAAPLLIEQVTRAELSQNASPARAIVIGEAAEQLLAASHTSQPVYAKADIRSVLKALIARGDAQSDKDVSRVRRFIKLQTAIEAGDSKYLARDIFSAYKELTTDEQHGLADALHSQLFSEKGRLFSLSDNADRAEARQFATILLDKRIEGAKVNPPSEPADSAGATRLITQTLRLADLLAAAHGSNAVSTAKGQSRIASVSHVEEAVALANAPWLTPDESAAFATVISMFKTGTNEGQSDATALAFLSALAVPSPNDVPEASTAAAALLDLLSKKSWADVEPKLSKVSAELRLLIANVANERLFGETTMTKYDGAAEVHVALQRIIRKKA